MFSVSVTTRLPRPGEKDGRDYFFVSEAAFKAMRARHELAEWARVHDHMYGTPKAFLGKMRARGKDVLLDLDVQGALAVKKRFPEAVLIFIRTPRFADLEKRLQELQLMRDGYEDSLGYLNQQIERHTNKSP